MLACSCSYLLWRYLYRCDQIADCSDKSDERDCQLVVLGPGYNMKIPPISFSSLDKRNVERVGVNVSLTLLRIVNIDEGGETIDFQFGIELGWFENRAKYQNLKDKKEMNIIPENVVSYIWLPSAQS